MSALGIVILITAIIQEYVCWMTYINWFKHEITHCKMKDSYSIIGMILLLPSFVWIPIVPIILTCWGTNIKYLTIK